MTIVLSTEIHVDSQKTETFSLSNMHKQLVATCIKYYYVLLINLHYIFDPPFLLHAILETALAHMCVTAMR